MDGRQVTTTVTQEGPDKWVTRQVGKNTADKDVTVTRVFSEEGIRVEMVCGKVTSRQFYKRMEEMKD